MDNRQKRSVEHYRRIARDPGADGAAAVSRPASTIGKGGAIWRDIRDKLGLRRGCRFLDIGCGFGEVTQKFLVDADRLELDVVLVDIPEVVARLRREDPRPSRRIKYYGGIFPSRLPADFRREKLFDFVLAYSVLHYTDQPRRFIASACRLLAPGGRLLIGDLPNVHRKGRFLASAFGRQFESEYRGLPDSELPRYRDQQDYFRRCRDQNKRINDNLVADALRTYRERGYDVFVLPQRAAMPFGHTREDLLICRR